MWVVSLWFSFESPKSGAFKADMALVTVMFGFRWLGSCGSQKGVP